MVPRPGANDHAVFDLSAPIYSVLWSDSTGNTTSRSVLVQNGGVRFSQTNLPPVLVHLVLDDVTVESGSLRVDNHILTIQENLDVSDNFEAINRAQPNIFENMALSPNAGDNSNALISGADTTVNITNSLSVGQFGSSNLLVNDQAAVDIARNLLVGFDGFGIATFEGSGTTLSVGGGFIGGDITVFDNGSLGFFSGASASDYSPTGFFASTVAAPI